MTAPSTAYYRPIERRSRPMTPDMGWQIDAECGDAPADVSDRMTEATHQVDTSDLAASCCHVCPVRIECRDAGTGSNGYGLWGGQVLRHGRVAPRRSLEAIAAEQALAEPTRPEPTRPEPTRPEPVAPPSPATAATRPGPGRGQRRQPKRLPRSKRRRARLVGRIDTVCTSCYLTACDC